MPPTWSDPQMVKFAGMVALVVASLLFVVNTGVFLALVFPVIMIWPW